MRAGGGDGGGGFGREEEGGDCGDRGDDGDVEDHRRDTLRGAGGTQKRVDELAQSAAEGVCEGSDGSSRDTATRGEPEV